MNWNNNLIIQRAPGTVFRVVDGEAIIVHTQKATMAVLNETGQFIWSLLDHPLHINDLVDGLAADYDAPLEDLRPDALEFLRHLEAKGLIHVSDDGPS